MGLDDDDLDFLEITDAKERAMLSGNAALASPTKQLSFTEQQEMDDWDAKERAAAAMLGDSSDEDAGSAIGNWLAARGLGHLEKAFVEHEYTDVPVLDEMGLDDDDLDFLEISDAKERAILQGR